ncbi:MAG: hypothetical protein H0Z25_04705 [Kosmotoga sp.]|nr:hypothetical protein [Kosmotoga sp.]MBO8166502.1 hypothetical protein [Kosmotoga sp.]
MSIAELLVYLLILSLSLGIFSITAASFAEGFKIRIAKFKIDTFLEKMRQLAIAKSRRIKLYYRNDGRIIASTGDFIDKLPLKRNDPLIIGFSERGSFFVEKGSTVLVFSDDSTMSIRPVTGNLSY